MRIRTFGGLWIEAGATPLPPGARPRWLALLAILAAAGEKGVSRDRLLGILWPDTDEERSRHALSQTLYSLRRDVGATPVVGGNELRLDPAIARSDLGDFNSAIAAGDRWRALELYRGAFLDGFYLDAAPEFERWVEEQRARLARQAVDCAEAVAREATAKGDLTAAAAAWRRAVALDPLSSRYATAYMTVLANAGDRAGALAHAREHATTVRRELDATPDSEVTELVERLRRAPAKSLGQTPAVETTHPGTIPPVSPIPPAAPAPRYRRFWIPAALGVAALVLVTWALLGRNHASSSAPVLAVGRIRDVPAPDSSNFSGVLTDMLATNLSRVRGMQVVANSRLFELMKPATDTLRGAVSDAARRAGARQILEGELSFAREGGLQLDLRRIDLRSGVVRQGYRVRALDRYALVDSATAAVARDFSLAVPGGAIAEVSTASPVAYRFYEEGLRSFYQYDAAAAARLMQSALQEDSTFAIAAYYLWYSNERMAINSGDSIRSIAIRLAPRAPERERLLILGSLLASLESPAAAAYAESLSIRFPNDPSGQSLLGGIASTQGDYPRAVVAYNRAVALDSAANAIGGQVCRACDALRALAWVYLGWDSSSAAERTTQRWIRFQPGTVHPLGMLMEIAVRRNDWKAVASYLARTDSLSPGGDYRELSFYLLLRRGEYDAVGREALTALSDPRRDLRIDAVWFWIIALRNQGRLREAGDLLYQGRLPDGQRLPAGILPQEIPAATVEFEAGDYVAAAGTYAKQAAYNANARDPGHRARGMSWNLTLEGMARAAAGDTATVRRLADSVEVIGQQSIFGRSPRLHHFLRGLLLAREGRQNEAVEAYRRAVLSWTDGFTRINSELAKSLLALHRPAEAVSVLQPAFRGAIDASNLYITRTELHEQLAQAFVAAGRPDSATAHYREVARAWERADPPFQVRRRVALDWIQRHSR